MIWIIRVNPNNEPQFHMYEIEVGVGNFIKFKYNGLIMWVLYVNIFI